MADRSIDDKSSDTLVAGLRLMVLDGEFDSPPSPPTRHGGAPETRVPRPRKRRDQPRVDRLRGLWRPSGHLTLELCPVQLRVETVFGEQIGMRTGLDDPSLGHDQDQVGLANRR